MGELSLVPSEPEVVLLSKLATVFGTDGAREILRMLKAIVLRRLSSIIAWSNWYITKLDIAGVRLRLSFTRNYTDTLYELTVRVIIEDVDPVLVKRNLRTLYKMMKVDKDQERVMRDLDIIVMKHLREEELEKTGEET